MNPGQLPWSGEKAHYESAHSNKPHAYSLHSSASLILTFGSCFWFLFISLYLDIPACWGVSLLLCFSAAALSFLFCYFFFKDCVVSSYTHHSLHCFLFTAPNVAPLFFSPITSYRNPSLVQSRTSWRDKHPEWNQILLWSYWSSLPLINLTAAAIWRGWHHSEETGKRRGRTWWVLSSVTHRYTPCQLHPTWIGRQGSRTPLKTTATDENLSDVSQTKR